MMTNQSVSGTVDLGDLLNSSRWSAYQKWVLAFTAIAFAVDGLANQVLGIAIPALVENWNASTTDFAPVAALGLLGVALGSAGGGCLGDRVGRRWGLIGSMTLFGLATVGTALVNDVQSLMFLRLLDGLGIGGAIPNGAALISEFTPHRRRSRGIAIGMVFIPVGGFLAGSLGSFILPGYGWRAFFLVAGLLPLAAALLFIFVLPESPRFLGRRSDRRSELVKLLRRFGHHYGPDTQFSDRADQGETAKTPVSALLGLKMRRNTLGIWGAFFFCLMASYTMFSWVPTMLAGLEFGPVVTSTAISAFHLGGMFGGFACGFMIERYGSRLTLIGLAGGAITASVGLGITVAFPSPVALLVICIMVASGFFIAGIHNIVYTMATFAYPPVVKATGIGTAATVGRLGAILSSYTGVLTLEIGGADTYFATIAILLALCLGAGLAVRDHVPPAETDGRPEGSESEALAASETTS